jgi:hypothetical protein
MESALLTMVLFGAESRMEVDPRSITFGGMGIFLYGVETLDNKGRLIWGESSWGELEYGYNY